MLVRKQFCGMGAGLLLTSFGIGCSAADDAKVVRDLVEYATAVCLIEQKDDTYLKDQGYSWSSIFVQGEGYSIDALSDINAAVKEQLAKGDMIIVHDESSTSGSKALPLVFCARIGEVPAVRAAIDSASAKIRSDVSTHIKR